jgi:hypothetical protein
MSRQEIYDTRLAHSRLSGECQLEYCFLENIFLLFGGSEMRAIAATSYSPELIDIYWIERDFSMRT